MTGRVAMVTGGSRGIGLSAARGLAEAGATVAVCGRNKSSLDKVAKEMRTPGKNVLPVTLDVADGASIRSAVRSVIAEFGRIDILVNSAGTIHRVPAADLSVEKWDEVIDVNLKGTFLLCQEVGKHMISRRHNEGEGHSKIINVASLTSAIGVPNVVAYGSSKGGIVSLTRSLAVEWAKYGINVNAVAPGYIRTELTRALQEDNKRSDYIVSRIPLGRWGEPEDLQGTFVFLASSASDYVTGQVIYVDGGWTAS